MAMERDGDEIAEGIEAAIFQVAAIEAGGAADAEAQAQRFFAVTDGAQTGLQRSRVGDRRVGSRRSALGPERRGQGELQQQKDGDVGDLFHGEIFPFLLPWSHRIEGTGPVKFQDRTARISGLPELGAMFCFEMLLPAAMTTAFGLAEELKFQLRYCNLVRILPTCKCLKIASIGDGAKQAMGSAG